VFLRRPDAGHNVRRSADPPYDRDDPGSGQEVQLHLHPNWTSARAGDRGAAHDRFQLYSYSLAEQTDLLVRATELLVEAGAPHPIAFRAGSNAANDDTLTALEGLGFTYDSSHNGSEAPHTSRISLPARQIAPVRQANGTGIPKSW